MKVRRFERDTDVPMVNSWAHERGYAGDINEFAPDTGFVCGPCVGFLFLTNTKMAHIGSLICEPGTPRHVKDLCFGRVIRALRLLARNSGVKVLMTFPSRAGIYTSLKSCGFTDTYMDCRYLRMDI